MRDTHVRGLFTGKSVWKNGNDSVKNVLGKLNDYSFNNNFFLLFYLQSDLAKTTIKLSCDLQKS